MKNNLMRILPSLFVVVAAATFSLIPTYGQSKPTPKTKEPSTAAAANVNIAIPDIPYTKFVLANGLTVLVHEDHKAPIVAVTTWYHVGSKNERPGKTGFAHLFEHLMFSGSANFDHNYLKAMESIGATEPNGTTNNDRTNYFENVATSMLDYVLFAESDRMGHLLGVLDQKKLDLQRGVVQNEKRQGENRPYGGTNQILTENTYPVGHPYSWTVLGSMKDLDAASMSDVQEWFKTYYGPSNVTLVIAGDVTPEVAREKVEKYYGEIPPGPPITKREAWIAKRTGTHRDMVEDRVPQARVYRTWNVPQAYSPEEALLDLAAQVLGGGNTSRLYKRLIYKDQTATSATTNNSSDEIGGQFHITLTAKPGEDVKKVEAAADEELQNFLRSGPTQVELRLAKTQIFGQFARTMERIGGRNGKSDILARCQTFTGNPSCYKEYLERINAATPATVRRAANDWLSDGDYILEVQPYPATLKASAPLDRSKEPTLGGAMSLKLPPMQKATLSNGLKIVLVERHTAPLVNFNLLVDSGYSSDPVGAPGTASFEQLMISEGTSTRDSLKIGEDLESYGANFSANADPDWVNVNLNVLKANMDKALDTYADIILHPAFPQREFDRLQKAGLAALQRDKTAPRTIAFRVAPILVYGKSHPYAETLLTASGTEDSVSKMTRDDLLRFHDTWFKPNNATLLIVGDTTLAEITPKLETLFAPWNSGDVPKKIIPQVPLPEKVQVYLIDRPGSGQSYIVGAQLGPSFNNPDEVPLELVSNIFVGPFSARLNMNLREDKHWSYGVGSARLPTRAQELYLSTAPVQTDKTKESLIELVKEYKNIVGDKPISATELKDQQSDLTLGLPARFETLDGLGGRLAGYTIMLEYNLPEDYYNTLTEKTWAVTPAIANEVAKKYIFPGHLVWIVIGDMSKVEAGIRELNIGEVHKIDADGNPVK